MFTLLKIAIALWFQYYPTAYILTDTKPLPEMRDLGAISISAFEVSSGQLVPTCYQGHITNYIVWLNPKRDPMYLVYFNSDRYVTMVEINRLPQIEC